MPAAALRCVLRALRAGLVASLIAGLVGAAGLTWHLPAQAHATATGLASIDAGTDSPHWRLTITPSELGAPAADIAPAAQGHQAAAQRVAGWLAAHVALAVDDQPCRIKRTRIQGSPAGDERLALLLDFSCPATPGTLTVTDRLSAVFGEHYRTIASVRRADGSHEELVLDREHPEARFALGRSAPEGWWGFGRLGVAHILSGADHLLFLAALLVGSRSLRGLLLTVTAFTLAHSAALALAVLGWVDLSPRIVEPLIAASIVAVALENLWLARAGPASPPAAGRRAALAFAFGLIHGLAFSEALRDLGLTGWPLARALLGFNLGVEAGQALLVLVLAPALAWAARRPAAARWERAASAGIGAAGVVWLVQRLAG
ncbi:HupE/UreJ family protein [Ideonella sp. DXS22W]|uniref:HupE/UreJ family protein n=1 Tax=Pseudaquabacterium inlustre TaxID=2984192 RepID=A0ABU9CHX4_9BURK